MRLRPGRDAEKRLALLAELYRQGHNMDVQGAAETSAASIEQCLDAFPAPRACHFAASFLYLSVRPTPEHLALAERSPSVLREQALPGHSDGAEAGYVFLYVYRQDPRGPACRSRAPRASPPPSAPTPS